MLTKQKYRLLFSPERVRLPGPKGPTKELIDAVVAMKRRNPTWGCKRIAQQIALAFGVDIDKDVVRRILGIHFRQEGCDGRSDPNVVPMDLHIRQYFKNHREQQCNNAKRESNLQHMPNSFAAGKPAPHAFTHCSNNRAENEGYQEEKTCAEHHGVRCKAPFEEPFQT